PVQSPSDQTIKAPEKSAPGAPGEKSPAVGTEKSPIVISRGPNGIMIASDDVAALDEFERLLNSMTSGTDPDRTELNVFYLKYAKATAVAETLTKIIGSGTSTSSSTSTDSSILGQLVTGSLGSTMGSLLNLGASTLSPTGMLRITAEPRLNALIVEANATDLRTIQEVLKLLDQPQSPEEVLVTPKARLIPVYNLAASEVAEIVKQVFAEKMQGGSSRGGGSSPQPPSPADIFAAMRGGRSGGEQRGGSSGGSSNAPKEEPERMTVGIDERSNSLIVFASQQTFEEVQLLVEELDSIAGVAEDEATQVVTINGNPEAMKAALMAIMGENATTNSTSSSSGRSSSPSRTSSRTGSSSGGSPSFGGTPEDVQRRMEFFRSMMGRGGSTGGPPGGFGGNRGGGDRSGGGR
ncbi:MAG: secretin N-terminal domain-containing protein, partial [Thermoguttaceae bacterium]